MADLTAPDPLTVGFDLDMTLVDSRTGIVATIRAVLDELGVAITDEQVWRGIGTPLEQVFAPLLPPDLVPGAVHRYRELYPTTGVPGITLLPGAVEALDAVRRLHGRVAVVSTKVESAVRLVLGEVGLTADVVSGGLFAGDKGLALTEHGCRCTWATTSVTSRAHGPPARRPSPSRPGRRAPRCCGRPARTSCCPI